MKVLWFSNCVLGIGTNKGSGSWLYAMKGLISADVELFNITQSNVKDIVYYEHKDLKEYILPVYSLKNNLPSQRNINKIKNIVEQINPDIIHIWGIELYWGLLFSRGYIKRNCIIEIQGLLSSCYNVYYAGLSPCEILKCYSLKELIKYNLYLPFEKSKTNKRSVVENEIIAKTKLISTQSQWVRNQIKFRVGYDFKVYKTLRPIRKSFYNSTKWTKSSNKSIVLFTSFSYIVPFKGFHILIKSLAHLKNKYSDFVLNVAGIDIKSIPFYRKDGYLRFILSLIKKYNLVDNINFIGRLNENEMIDYLLKSDVYINPSFVESYSAASAEALYLGVPSVLSYAGAMPDFSNQKEVALYYSPMDFVDLASKVSILMEDNELSNKLSKNSIDVLEDLSNREIIKNTQLSIYSEIYNNVCNSNN